MGLKYFDISKDAEANKTMFRDWCKKLHPDLGGDAAKFAEMKEEYINVDKHFKQPKKPAQAARKRDDIDALEKMFIQAAKAAMEQSKNETVKTIYSILKNHL